LWKWLGGRRPFEVNDNDDGEVREVKLMNFSIEGGCSIRPDRKLEMRR
jgi:hypothetical protein